MSIREELVRDGYAVVPKLISPVRIAELRGIVDAHFRRGGNIFKLGKTQPNAATMIPALASLFADPKVIEAFREALGEDGIVFTGHCDVHKGMFSGWHKDTGPAHGYFADDCFAPGCEVYKLGLYLQDNRAGEGLTVVPGSHRERGIRETDALELNTDAGDAIIFDVRLTHRGKVSDKIDKWLYRANQVVKLGVAKLRRRPVAKDDLAIVYRLRRMYDVATGRRHRHSIFFTFGRPNTFTDQFAAANWVRQQDQNRSARTLPPVLVEALEAQQVVVAAPIRAAA